MLRDAPDYHSAMLGTGRKIEMSQAARYSCGHPPIEEQSVDMHHPGERGVEMPPLRMNVSTARNWGASIISAFIHPSAPRPAIDTAAGSGKTDESARRVDAPMISIKN